MSEPAASSGFLKAYQEQELLELLDQEELARARRSYWAFLLRLRDKFVVNWHHKALATVLNRWVRGDVTRGDPTHLIVSEPPRHAKSEMVSRFLPPYVFGRYPTAKIAHAGYGADLVKSFKRDIWRNMNNREYSRMFPNTRITLGDEGFEDEPNGKRAFEIRDREGKPTGGQYRCAGVRGALTGFGADFLIIDDPIKDDIEAESANAREALWNWYNAVAETRLENNIGGNPRVLITMTRWHEDDLVGRLLRLAKSDPGAQQWAYFNLEAIRETPGDKDANNLAAPFDPRELGEPLWPWRRRKEQLEKVRKALPTKFYAMYQGRPSSPKGAIIKREWCTNFYRSLPKKFDEFVTSWDFAFKDKADSDYVVGQAWGRIGAEFYLVDEIREQMGFSASCAALLLFAAKWRPHHPSAHLIEDKANGTAIEDEMDEKIPRLLLVEPKGGKKVRLQATEGLWKAGNVKLPHPDIAPWISDWIEELVTFDKAPNDDRVDAASQALVYLDAAELDYVRSLAKE